MDVCHRYIISSLFFFQKTGTAGVRGQAYRMHNLLLHISDPCTEYNILVDGPNLLEATLFHGARSLQYAIFGTLCTAAVFNFSVLLWMDLLCCAVQCGTCIRTAHAGRASLDKVYTTTYLLWASFAALQHK